MTNIILHNNVLAVHNGASLSAVGMSRPLHTAKLSNTLSTASNRVSTVEDISSWQVGDVVVFTGPITNLTSAPRKTITSIVDDHTFIIDSAIDTARTLDAVPTYTDHIFNLTRELQIAGFNLSARGAMRVLDAGKVNIRNAEFSNWGILNDTTRDGIVFAANNANTSTIEYCSLSGDFAATTNFISHYPSFRTQGPSLFVSNNTVYNVNGNAIKISPSTAIPASVSAIDNKFVVSNVRVEGISGTNNLVLSGNQFISSFYPAAIVDFRWINSPIVQNEGYFGNRSFALSAANLIDMKLDSLTATFNDRVNQWDIGAIYLTNCQNATAQSIISTDNYYQGIFFDKVYHSSTLIDSEIKRNLSSNVKILTPNSLSLSAFNIKNTDISHATYNDGINYSGSLNLCIDDTSVYNNPRHGLYMQYTGNATIVSEDTPPDIAFAGPSSSSSALIDASNNYIVIPHNTKFAHGNNEFTYEAYVNVPNTNGARYIFDARSDAQINEMFMYIYNGGLYTGNNSTVWPKLCDVTANTWHHVAVCRDLSLSKYSAAFNGAGHLTLANDIDITGGDYTVECQVLFTANNIGYQGIFSRNDTAGDYKASLLVFIEAGNTINCAMTYNGSSWTTGIGSGIVPQINTWYHIAVTKLGNVVTLWVNGVSAGTYTLTAPLYNVNQSWCIGSYRNFPGNVSRPLNGYISGFRIVTGAALYTSPGPFPVPTTSPTAVPGTQLLLNFNDPTATTSANWYDDTSGFNRIVRVNGNVTHTTNLPIFRAYFNGVQVGNSRIDTYFNKSLQLSIGSRYSNQEYLGGYISQFRVNQSALYPTNPIPDRVNDNHTFTTNVILSTVNSTLSSIGDTAIYMDNTFSTLFLTPNIIDINNNTLAAGSRGIYTNNTAGQINENIFKSHTTETMNVSIGNRSTLVNNNTAYLVTGRAIANIRDGLNYFPTIFNGNEIYSDGEYNLLIGGIGLYNREAPVILTSWPACLRVANPSQIQATRNSNAILSFYTLDLDIQHLKIEHSGVNPAMIAALYVDDVKYGNLTSSPITYSISPATTSSTLRKITIIYSKINAAEHHDIAVCIQNIQYSYDGINFYNFAFEDLYYNNSIQYTCCVDPIVYPSLYTTQPYYLLTNINKTNFKKYHVLNTINASLLPISVKNASGPILGSYIIEHRDVSLDTATVKTHYQDNIEKSAGFAWTTSSSINTIAKIGNISFDRSVIINNQSNAPSEVLYPTSANTYNKLKSAKKYIPVVAGNKTKVYTFVKVSAAYNGTPPKLVVSQHAALGVESDRILQEFTALTGTWQILQGTIDASDKDGVLEFYVECDGTAGYVAVDSWAAPI